MPRSPRRYWRDRRGLAVMLVCLGLVAWRWLATGSVQAGPDVLEEGHHEVRLVMDDGTLLLVSGARVRLQGIETPESALPEAKKLAEEFIDRPGRRVRLTFGLERTDDRGCFLAFVWHDDAMLNEELVRAGLARARLEYRHSGRMTRRLAAAEDEARRALRGIWSE